MNRTEVITGSAIAVLAAVGIGQLYLDKGAMREAPQPKQVEQAKAEDPKPITADEVVSGFMTDLERGEPTEKIVALTSLLDQLESPTYAKAALSDETAGPLAQAAIAAVTVSTEAETPEIAGLRVRAAGFIASRTRGEAAKAYVLEMLEKGDAPMRETLAHNVGRPHGVRGKAVFEKLQELGAKGRIPATELAGALQRLGGKKALDPVMAQLKAESDWKALGAIVTALQDYKDPALLAPAFERLGQVGVLEKNEKLPWISAALYEKFMEKADGAALRDGLRAAKTRPSLVAHAASAVKRGLDDASPETRRVAAEAVRKAVIAKVMTPQDGEAMLAGRLGKETEPVLKAEFTGALDQVRGVMPKSPVTQQ